MSPKGPSRTPRAGPSLRLLEQPGGHRLPLQQLPDPDGVVTNDRWGFERDGSRLGDFSTPERRNMNSIIEKKWELCDSLDPHSWGYSKHSPRAIT